MKKEAWKFATRALWIPIAYFGMKGCFDSACVEAQEAYKLDIDREVVEYVTEIPIQDLYVR